MAARLGYIHIDTGAMYRALTWLALQKGIDPSDEAALGELAQKARIRFSLDAAGRQLTWCEEEDVTEAIRTSSVSRFVSVIAAIPAVRQALVEQQRRLACRQNVVMDGRDIGTVVLPKAECKIFLTASPQERALRRSRELAAAGQKVDLDALAREIAVRDYQDSHRSTSPLRKAEDAVLLDTTGLSFEEVVKQVTALAAQKAAAGQSLT